MPSSREIALYRSQNQELSVQDHGIDIRVVNDSRFPAEGVNIDWSLRSDGTLDDTQALATAVMVALGTDHYADASEPLPDPDSTDRRGWWGDLDADVIWDGWPIGSKLWLLKREKITGFGAYQGATTVRVENYIRDAIQPFIDQSIGSQMSVQARQAGRHRIDALVTLYRGANTEVQLRFSCLWSDIVASSADVQESVDF